MGFWNIFFSERNCEYCNSYNTERINFSDLPERIQDMYWDYAGYKRPEKVYKCKDCHQITIVTENGGVFWTKPKK